MIRVDTVAVCKAQIIQDTDAFDQDILAADQMCRPEAAAGERHIAQRQMGDMLQKKKRYAGVKAAVNMPLRDGSIKNAFIAVYFSAAGNRDVFAILRV